MIAQFEMNDERFRIIEAIADAIGFGTDTGAYRRTQATYCGVSGALWNYGYGGRQIIWNPLTSTEDAVEVMLEFGLKVVANRGELIMVWSSEDQNPVYVDSLGAELSDSELKLKFRQAVVIAALILYSPATLDKLSKQC